MLNVAREKNAYKNLYTRFLGPYPIKGIERGELDSPPGSIPYGEG